MKDPIVQRDNAYDYSVHVEVHSTTSDTSVVNTKPCSGGLDRRILRSAISHWSLTSKCVMRRRICPGRQRDPIRLIPQIHGKQLFVQRVYAVVPVQSRHKRTLRCHTRGQIERK